MIRRSFAKRPRRGVFRFTPPAAWGVVATDYGRLFSPPLEAARKVARRFLRREGRLRLLVFPAWPATAKPLQSRMGRGKGKVAGHFCWVRPGQLLFSLHRVEAAKAQRALQRAAVKLPLSVRVVPLSSLLR